MIPDEQDVEGFLDSVSDVQRLIAGLKAGTISPEYVDSKIQAATASTEAQSKAGPRAGRTQQQQRPGVPAQQPAAPDVPEQEAVRQAELQKKVEELKASRQRKLRARQLYEQHASQAQRQLLYATDYTQWDLWCPSDEEDDLFNSCTANNPQFRAMERDITDRHNRMVEQRQIAERQRQLGNAAFKAGQFSEALRCYQSGLEAQRHNMTLHANAAMAALKLKCYVQALEHCDKVLHLAEVLYNKPQHELCVKALQRRAAAYQGLQQHSKAVADLEAAAAMLPDDGEIGQQLQAAKVLLDEQKTAKALRQLVAGAAGRQTHEAPNQDCPSRSSSSSGSADLFSLQRIEQLTAALNAAAASAAKAAGAAAGPEQSIAACCGQLQGLILRPPRNSTFFRECGGLDALAKLVPRLEDSAARAASLQLLAAACDNQTTLQLLCSQHSPLLAAVLDCISTPGEPAAGRAAADGAAAIAAAAAAVDLAHTASTVPQMRQAVCQQLLLQWAESRHQQHQQQALCEELQGSSLCRLERLWLLACAPQPHHEVAPVITQLQVTAVSLLSNCLLVPAVRDAAAAMLSHRPSAVEDLAHLLKECSGSPGSTSSAAAVPMLEKLCGLASNASSHPNIRKQLAQHQLLVQRLIATALPGRRQQAGAARDSSGPAAAALGCLCNLSPEACVQQQLVDQDTTAALLQLTLPGAPLLAACGPTATGAGLGGARLPKRGPASGGRQQQTAAAAADDAGALRLRQQRAALLLSRVAKSAAGLQLLQVQGALGKLLQALACHLQQQRNKRQPQQQQQQQQQSDLEHQGDASWVEAVMRIVALMTAAPGACASCSATEASAAIDACLALLRAPAGAVKGNAALCLGHFAAERQWHATLHQADAVGALVAAAADGKGDAASRNAGIALAKMARDERMMERLRELRGLEVIYAYVKP